MLPGVSSLPPALGAYIARAVQTGAAPIPNLNLSTTVPTAGPISMDFGGRFRIDVYGGSLMRFQAVAQTGGRIDMLG